MYEDGLGAADGLAVDLAVEGYLKPPPRVLGIARILQTVLVTLHKELETKPETVRGEEEVGVVCKGRAWGGEGGGTRERERAREELGAGREGGREREERRRGGSGSSV